MGSFEWMEVETLSTEITVLESRLSAAKSRHNYGLVKVVREQIAAAQQRRARYLAHITTSLAESLEPASRPETALAAETSLAESADPLPLPATAPVAQPRQRAVAQKNREEIAASNPPSKLADPVTDDAQEEPAELDRATAELADPATQEEPAKLAEPDQPNAELADSATEQVPEPLAKPDRPSADLADPVAVSGVAPPITDTIEGVTNVWDQLTPTHIEHAKHELGIRRAEMLARHAEELKSLAVDQSEIDALNQAIDAFVQKFNSLPAANSVIRLDEERGRLQNQA